MVVGPSMSGKSCFVKELLESDHIEYENHRKCRKIHWFYGQYQDMFKDMKRSLGQDIYFQERLPMFQLDLSDIDPKFNNIIVLDDLMDLAVDSPIISKLFTQGRHRNASVILLLQIAFPKSKYNTSISRNAQYIALLRCPAERRQIGIMVVFGYLDRIYVPVIPGSKSYIRFTMVDEELQKVDFTSNKFHIVLHFKRKELYIIWEVSCECYVVENANKIIETEQCFTCPLSPPFCGGRYVLRTRLSRDPCQSQTWLVG